METPPEDPPFDKDEVPEGFDDPDLLELIRTYEQLETTEARAAFLAKHGGSFFSKRN